LLKVAAEHCNNQTNAIAVLCAKGSSDGKRGCALKKWEAPTKKVVHQAGDCGNPQPMAKWQIKLE
jgi:hypothetical protein